MPRDGARARTEDGAQVNCVTRAELGWPVVRGPHIRPNLRRYEETTKSTRGDRGYPAATEPGDRGSPRSLATLVKPSGKERAATVSVIHDGSEGASAATAERRDERTLLYQKFSSS